MRQHILSLLTRSFLLCLLIVSSTLAVHASSDAAPAAFEPPLRDLWTRGSERFLRQWLIAGPVQAATAEKIDASSLQPASDQPLASIEPAVRWIPHTSYSDITDLSAIVGRPTHRAGAVIDRFVFVAAPVQSATAGPMELSIGSGRPYAAWLN